MSESIDRVMVDIETLGTDPGCAVISIGAVQFDGDGLGDTFTRSISLSSCQDAGLTIDAGTLEWWLEQDEDAQHVLTGGDDLAGVLRDFTSWMGVVQPDEMWANSPSFDCVILASAFDAVDMDVPWEFWEQRDCRTVKNLPCALDVDHDGTDHDALDDARYQARVVMETLRVMQEAQI